MLATLAAFVGAWAVRVHPDVVTCRAFAAPTTDPAVPARRTVPARDTTTTLPQPRRLRSARQDLSLHADAAVRPCHCLVTRAAFVLTHFEHGYIR